MHLSFDQHRLPLSLPLIRGSLWSFNLCPVSPCSPHFFSFPCLELKVGPGTIRSWLADGRCRHSALRPSFLFPVLKWDRRPFASGLQSEDVTLVKSRSQGNFKSSLVFCFIK
ncbi:hypothetical protein AVEN_234904-1 [Araneus ventricosus]|uniref:Uncharacterized protein n=1 Tax=Araneus ventricosus TaxID=182803 RepID=A0A4Y2H628_ARAVE|nr:hypothetical protein AVEN_234904-1 [Araneus ventricosus]